MHFAISKLFYLFISPKIVVGKLKTVAVDVVDKDAIKVRWRLDCSDRVGIVTGYKISYCPISDHNPTSASPCVEEQSEVVTAPDVEKKWLEDLKPWTYYKVGVAVLTRAGESEISDFLVNRTKSARPGSPPDELEVFLKGRNQAVLSWEPPKEPNGPIAMYAIRYKYTNFLGKDQILSASTDQHRFKLDNLVFNAAYTVSVVACTEVAELSEPVCGKDWAEANVITGIGPSGIMPSPLVTFKNSTEVKIEWGHGFFHKGGPLHHFDIKIIHQTLNRSVILEAPGHAESSTVSLAKIGENEDWTPDCSNKSITNLYNFTIRAVTVDRSIDQTYEGEWSPTEVTPAYCTSKFYIKKREKP